MSSAITKKIIAFAAMAIFGFVAYYGSYLPMVKAQVFIATLRNLRSAVPTFEVFKSNISQPLDLPSPIGQEELVRNSTNLVLNLVSSNNDPQTVINLVNLAESYYKPIIDKGTGMSFGQNLYILGALNETAFLKTRMPEYLEKSKKYYEKGVELGPNRPQSLYGLFDVYRIAGDVERVKFYAGRILTLWPDDQRTGLAVDDFLQRVAEYRAKQGKAK